MREVPSVCLLLIHSCHRAVVALFLVQTSRLSYTSPPWCFLREQGWPTFPSTLPPALNYGVYGLSAHLTAACFPEILPTSCEALIKGWRPCLELELANFLKGPDSKYLGLVGVVVSANYSTLPWLHVNSHASTQMNECGCVSWHFIHRWWLDLVQEQCTLPTCGLDSPGSQSDFRQLAGSVSPREGNKNHEESGINKNRYRAMKEPEGQIPGVL
jgi:hypothetical protein